MKLGEDLQKKLDGLEDDLRLFETTEKVEGDKFVEVMKDFLVSANTTVGGGRFTQNLIFF